MSDIVERLERLAVIKIDPRASDYIAEGIAEIETLRARVAELEGCLNTVRHLCLADDRETKEPLISAALFNRICGVLRSKTAAGSE